MRTILIISALMLCASCTASLRANMAGASTLPVFNKYPDRPFRVISIVGGQDSNMDDALDEIRIEAKKLNADAVVLIRPENSKALINNTVIIGNVGGEIVLQGEAIQFE